MSPNQDSPTPNTNGQPQNDQAGPPSPVGPPPNIIQPSTPTQMADSATPNPMTVPTAAAGEYASAPQQAAQQFGSSQSSASPYTIPTQGGVAGTTLPPYGADGSKKKKKMLIIGAAVAAVLLLAGGVVFGLYIPNQPQNVYKSGLSRSGKAMDKLLTEATQEEKLKNFENSELSGSLEFTGPTGNYKGSFSSKYDAKQSDSTVKYEQDAEGGKQALDVRFLTDLADNKQYPDMFFQINGLRSLGLDEFVPGLSDYDGKWINISADYLKSQIPAETDQPDQKIEFTQKDAADLAQIVTKTTREYVFTTEPDKAVLTQKSFVGTEKLDNGITANHYIMGINKGNAEKYCEAITEAVMSSDAYKRVPGIDVNKIDEDKKSAIAECGRGVEDIDETETFDMWIDKRTKLIHKFRVHETDKQGVYVEVGQSYAKGDVIPMFVIYHNDEEKIDGKLTLEYDTKKSITKGTFTLDISDGGAGSFNDSTGDVIRDTSAKTEKYSTKASFEFKPYNGDVTIEKPASYIPIEKVFEKFGIDPAAFSNSGATSDFSDEGDFSELSE